MQSLQQTFTLDNCDRSCCHNSRVCLSCLEGLACYLADVLMCCSISAAEDNPPAPGGNFAASVPVDDTASSKRHSQERIEEGDAAVK